MMRFITKRFSKDYEQDEEPPEVRTRYGAFAGMWGITAILYCFYAKDIRCGVLTASVFLVNGGWPGQFIGRRIF